MCLLEHGDIESLTTNAIAERAGVSIGTLYQYFDGKQSILDLLVDREIGGLSERVLAIVRQSPGRAARERVRMIVGTAMDTYGGRQRVHRLLLAHALTRGTATRLNPLFVGITQELTQERREGADETTKRFTPGEAFVLSHAVAGVLRGLVGTTNSNVQRQGVEDALVQLVECFLNQE